MYLTKHLLLFSSVIISIQSHLVPPDVIGQNQLKRWCEYAYECFHDKIYVCGRGPQQTRTFLDVCDMYEFSCETNQIFVKIKETDTEPRCPNPGSLWGRR